MPVFCLSTQADYACRHSGACCTSGWPIHVESDPGLPLPGATGVRNGRDLVARDLRALAGGSCAASPCAVFRSARGSSARATCRSGTRRGGRGSDRAARSGACRARGERATPASAGKPRNEQACRKRWTRHGSTRYLWNEEQLHRAIEYVLYQQGPAMAVFSTALTVLYYHFPLYIFLFHFLDDC